ncbi:hypothetical protein Nmel_009778 [Mimus melanotis]
MRTEKPNVCHPIKRTYRIKVVKPSYLPFRHQTLFSFPRENALRFENHLLEQLPFLRKGYVIYKLTFYLPYAIYEVGRR